MSKMISLCFHWSYIDQSESVSPLEVVAADIILNKDECKYTQEKTPCKYGPIFVLYLYRIESNRVNTVQKWVCIYTAFFPVTESWIFMDFRNIGKY